MEKYWSDHKMLTHSNLDINLNDMYQYKLKSLFNSRVPPINDKIMAFTEWDNNMEKIYHSILKIIPHLFHLNGMTYFIVIN